MNLVVRVAPLVVGLAACDTGSFYLYTGHQYDQENDCVSDLVALDVESGNDPGATCDAKCLVGPDGDGGAVAYASTMCGPTPIGADVSGSNPACAAALAALARGNFCLDGGSGTNPLDASAE